MKLIEKGAKKNGKKYVMQIQKRQKDSQTSTRSKQRPAAD